MKRNEFFDIAEKMYVEQFITEAEIARRIGVCDRTIRRWKALGDWAIKRDGFYKANTISKDAMYALAKRMIDDFLYETNNNLFVDPSRINIFLNLTEEVIKRHNKLTYTKNEFIKIVRQVFDVDKEMDLDFQNIMLEDWDY